MDLVHKVGWVRDPHEWRARVDLVHPRVQLLIVLAGQEVAPVLGDEFEAIGLQICAGHGSDVLEEDQDHRLRSRLEPREARPGFRIQDQGGGNSPAGEGRRDTFN